MQAPAEPEMGVGLTAEVDPLGLGELGGVAVGGQDDEVDLLPEFELLTTALVVVFIYLWGLLHAESQLAVGVLLAAVPAVLWAMRRTGLAEPLASAARVSPKLLGTGCVLGTLALVVAL